MPKSSFYFEAYDDSGHLRKGKVSASSGKEAIAILKRKKLFILTIVSTTSNDSTTDAALDEFRQTSKQSRTEQTVPIKQSDIKMRTQPWPYWRIAMRLYENIIRPVLSLIVIVSKDEGWRKIFTVVFFIVAIGFALNSVGHWLSSDDSKEFHDYMSSRREAREDAKEEAKRSEEARIAIEEQRAAAKAFIDKTQPLIQAARRLQALREVGGDYDRYRDEIINFKTAVMGAPNDYDDYSNLYLMNMEKAATSFSSALRAWDSERRVKYGLLNQMIKRHFGDGDKYLADALHNYEGLERRSE